MISYLLSAFLLLLPHRAIVHASPVPLSIQKGSGVVNATLTTNGLGSNCFSGCRTDPNKCTISFDKSNSQLIHGTPNIYHIYVTNHDASDYTGLIPFYDITTQFANDLGTQNSYFDNLQSYKDESNLTTTTTFAFRGSTTVVVKQSKLMDTDIQDILTDVVITSGIFPPDESALYVLFFRGDFQVTTALNGDWGKNWCSHRNRYQVGMHKFNTIVIGDTSYGYFNGCSSFYMKGMYIVFVITILFLVYSF